MSVTWEALAALAGVALDPTALARLRRFAELLVAGNERTNLTRITGEAELLEKHLLDALLGARRLLSGEGAPPASLVDVGTGGGVPGIPLAVVWPGTRVLLVESQGKKAAFLADAARELGLERVEVAGGRAEDLARGPPHREAFEAATLRAVGSVATCLELGLPFLRPGGRLLLYRGPAGEEDEVLAARGVAPLLGGGEPRGVVEVLPGGARRRLVVVPKASATPARYPRRPGVPARSPLKAT